MQGRRGCDRCGISVMSADGKWGGLSLGGRGPTGIYGWIEWSDLLDWWQP